MRQEFDNAMIDFEIASAHKHRSREYYRLSSIWDTMNKYDNPLTLGFATGEWLERQIEEVERIDAHSHEREKKRRKVAAREINK